MVKVTKTYSGVQNGGIIFPVPSGQGDITKVTVKGKLVCSFNNNPVFAAAVVNLNKKSIGMLGRYWLNCGLPWEVKTYDATLGGDKVVVASESFPPIKAINISEFSKQQGGITHIIISPNQKPTPSFLSFINPIAGGLAALTEGQTGGGVISNITIEYEFNEVATIEPVKPPVVQPPFSIGLQLPCENSGQCQSQNCYQGKCLLFNDKPCQWDSNCASNYCAGMDGKGGMVGTCKNLPKEGRPLGEWCYTDGSCASGLCSHNHCTAKPAAGAGTGGGTGGGTEGAGGTTTLPPPTYGQCVQSVEPASPLQSDTVKLVVAVAFIAIIGGGIAYLALRR